jgi:hypothetical protein
MTISQLQLYVASLAELSLGDLFDRVDDEDSKIFPGYARLGKYQAQCYLDTGGGVPNAEGVLREVLFRAKMWPHDDLIDQKDHPWKWLTSSTKSQTPPHPTTNDEWLDIHPFRAVLQGRTPLDSGIAIVYPPWFQDANRDNLTDSDLVHKDYHRVLGYPVTDPRRSYEIRYSAGVGLHAVANRKIEKEARLSFYGLCHVPRVYREHVLYEKRMLRGDYTHLLLRDHHDTYLLDGKFALPTDSMSGLGAFLNTPDSGETANVRKMFVKLPVLPPNNIVFTSYVLVLQAKREIAAGEQLTLQYSDCDALSSKQVLESCDVDAELCKKTFPHLY